MLNPVPTTGAAGPTAGVLRSARAGAVAATVLGLAAGAHVAGGGGLPAPFLLSGLAVVVLAVCLLLAGRRFSLPVLTGVLGGGQLALHTVFGVCSDPTVTVSATGHHQQVVTVSGLAAAGTAPDLSPALSLTTAPAMTAAHVAATLVAVVLLVHGENLLWQVWSWLRPLARVLVELVRFVRPLLRPVGAAVLARPRSVVARRVRRRGPPRVPALATTS